jgi:hypothetical protein
MPFKAGPPFLVPLLGNRDIHHHWRDDQGRDTTTLPPGPVMAKTFENVPTFFECGPRSLLVETRT